MGKLRGYLATVFNSSQKNTEKYERLEDCMRAEFMTYIRNLRKVEKTTEKQKIIDEEILASSQIIVQDLVRKSD